MRTLPRQVIVAVNYIVVNLNVGEIINKTILNQTQRFRLNIETSLFYMFKKKFSVLLDEDVTKQKQNQKQLLKLFINVINVLLFADMFEY